MPMFPLNNFVCWEVHGQDFCHEKPLTRRKILIIVICLVPSLVFIFPIPLYQNSFENLLGLVDTWLASLKWEFMKLLLGVTVSFHAYQQYTSQSFAQWKKGRIRWFSKSEIRENTMIYGMEFCENTNTIIALIPCK